MTHEQAIKINKRRGNIFPIWYIEQFAEEWDALVSKLKACGADLSKIALVRCEDEK